MKTLSRQKQEHPILKLEDYDVSPDCGFLPVHSPAQVLLPKTCQMLVETLAMLPQWLTCGSIRDRVDLIPEIDVDQLTLEPLQSRRLMLLYSFLTHAYVWGESPPAIKLPRNIAIPFYKISQRLGRPPILSYASYAQDNWVRINKTGPIAIGNIMLVHNFWGGLDENWFILVHIEIEANAAPAIAAIPQILEGITRNHAETVGDSLEAVKRTWIQINATMRRMPENCDPYIYFHRVRPFIHGWKNNPALAKGLIYEGVPEYDNQPQQFRGETGAQSALVPTMDALFNITHAPDPLRTYLMEMKNYMPPKHRAFVEFVETTVNLREFVRAKRGEMPHLQHLYNECLDLIDQFRTQHLEFAAHYIHQQSSQIQNDANVGTGGTPFMQYLKKHRDETKQHVLK